MNDCTTKLCPCCKTEFPATTEYFYKHKLNKSGLSSYCKACTNAKNQAWRDANPERWQQINRNNSKRWQDEHPDERRRHQREQGRRERASGLPKHIERRKRNARSWQLKNPEANRAKARRYWARKHGAEGVHTARDVELLYKSQKGLCWWCSKPVGDNYQVDHRIPLIQGGSDKPSNLCISCESCNKSKGGKMPHEWNGRLL